MVFYLKLNRLIDYSIRNLQTWMNAISLFENPEVYILCDNDMLNERIKKEVDFKGVKTAFLKSIKKEEYKPLMEAIAVPRWYNAGYAHLTPFIHSNENDIPEFWNIDADDTMLCLSPERLKEALEYVRNIAVSERIDLFSLDMWRSRSNGMHWSFGITYTNGLIDWIEIMNSHTDCNGGSMYFINGNHPKNIDEYFTYIKAVDKNVRIETFCIDKLLFLHYSDDFIMNPITSGVYKWNGKKLLFPIIKNVYGIDSLGEIDIADDVIHLDIGLTDFEGGFSIARIAPFSIEATNIIEAKEYEDHREKLMHKQIIASVSEMASKKDILRSSFYIFGFGKYTHYLIDTLRKYGIDPEAILDNAEFKWGKSINGINVCSPNIIEELEKTKLVILVAVRHFDAIKHQLLNLGIDENKIYRTIDYTKCL